MSQCNYDLNYLYQYINRHMKNILRKTILPRNGVLKTVSGHQMSSECVCCDRTVSNYDCILSLEI